ASGLRRAARRPEQGLVPAALTLAGHEPREVRQILLAAAGPWLPIPGSPLRLRVQQLPGPRPVEPVRAGLAAHHLIRAAAHPGRRGHDITTGGPEIDVRGLNVAVALILSAPVVQVRAAARRPDHRLRL